jgi:hypothetical protein
MFFKSVASVEVRLSDYVQPHGADGVAIRGRLLDLTDAVSTAAQEHS